MGCGMVVLLCAARQGKKYVGLWSYRVPPARARNMWGYGCSIVCRPLGQKICGVVVVVRRPLGQEICGVVVVVRRPLGQEICGVVVVVRRPLGQEI